MTPRILIVDDSPPIRDLMAGILNACGYRVTIAEDGLAAWEEIGRDLPNMVVMDIEMPRLDGCEVCRRIKSQPETSSIPVLLVSGCGGEIAERAHRSGADAFLNKPFSLNDLRARVDSLLNQTLPRQTALTAR